MPIVEDPGFPESLLAKRIPLFLYSRVCTDVATGYVMPKPEIPL